PTLVTASITSVVPTTASRIHVAASRNYKGAGFADVQVAPSQNYSGTNNGPEGSNGVQFPLHLATGTGDVNIPVWLLIETTTLSWASTGNGGAIGCLGWEDNI